MQQLLFYIFSLAAIVMAVMMVCSRNPVRAALFLVFTFVAVCPLWLMLEAEFLALVLVFVYIGAVMTLFLFVVMMLNLEQVGSREGFVKLLPVKFLIFALLLAVIFYVLSSSHFAAFHPLQWFAHKADYSNTEALGLVLYTRHALAFELAAVILLVAIVAAISLAFRGLRKRRTQRPGEQVKVRPEDRVTLVSMPAEKRT